MTERYSPEMARREAEEMVDLAGENASAYDLNLAENIVESSKTYEEQIERMMKGDTVVLIPKIMDKNPMIAFQTNDPRLFELFNTIAARVTCDYSGFWQIGCSENKGMSAWELWNPPEEPYEIVRKINEEMSKLRDRYIIED